MSQTRPTHHLNVLVLKRTKLAEQDLILTVLTQTGAQRKVVAKAARKPGSRFTSAVELFSEVDMLLAEGRTLDSIYEAKLINPHKTLREDYKKVEAACCLCEIVFKASFEDMHDKLLYPMTSRALKALEEVDAPELLALVVCAYVFKFLAHLGWMPQLNSCSLCSDPEVSSFSAEAGGVLCGECAKHTSNVMRVHPEEIKWIQALLSLRFDDIVTQHITQSSARKLLQIAHRWSTTHMETRVKSLEYMLFDVDSSIS